MDPYQYQTLKDEVEKLLDIRFIQEAFYPDWLTNPVLVKSQTESGGLVWTSWNLIKLAQKIASCYLASTS